MKKKIVVFICMAIFILPIAGISQHVDIKLTSKSDEAIKLYKEGLNNFENSERYKAYDLFSKAIQLDESFAMAYMFRSFSIESGTTKSDLDKAVCLAADVSDGERLFMSYFLADLRKADNLSIQQVVDNLLAKFPNNKRAQLTAGHYQMYRLKNLEKALPYFKKALELDPSYASVYNFMGYCYAGLNNFEESEKALQQYIGLIPDKPNGYDSYAEILLKQGKFKASIDNYKKAASLNDKYWSAHFGLGQNYTLTENYELAREHFNKALEITPFVNQKLYAKLLVATTYVYEGKVNLALKEFDERMQLAEKANKPIHAIFNLAYKGFLLTENNKYDQGIACYQEALKRVENSEMPKEKMKKYCLYGSVWLMYAHAAQQSFDKVDEYMNKCKTDIATRKEIDELNMYYSVVGYVELQKGNYDKAIEFLSKTEIDNTVNTYFLALAHKKKGDVEKARDLFENITVNNENSFELALVRQRAVKELNGK